MTTVALPVRESLPRAPSMSDTTPIVRRPGATSLGRAVASGLREAGLLLLVVYALPAVVLILGLRFGLLFSLLRKVW